MKCMNPNRQPRVDQTDETYATDRTNAVDRTSSPHKSYSFHKSFFCLPVAIVLAIATRMPAQDAASKPPARTFVGATQCVKCHLNGLPKETDTTLVAAGFGELADDSWVLLDELKTWAAADKHSQAYTALKNERSKRMGQLLGVESIHRDKRCLACHTGFPLASMGDDPHLISADLVNDLKVAQGVSCEGCHAPAGEAKAGGDMKGWYVPHAQKDAWRFLSAEDKLDKFGFVNIRSPMTRTRLCLSCHLGNAAEGKIVTHEMYAAGHPPLPGFELETFANQMPKHWREFHKKADGVRDEFLKRNADDIYGRESYKLDNLHETRAALVAALVAFSENLKLVSSLAEQLQMPVIKPDWPELAQFECFACHHDLKDKSWRQRRTVRGTPGRPMLRAWPTVLAKLALKTLGQDPKQLDRRMLPVEKLLSEQPFGRPDHWYDAVNPVTDWLDQQAVELERKPLPRDTGLSLLRDFVAVADSEFWDYDSARQLVWAIQVLRRELATDRSPEAVRNTITLIDAELTDVEKLFALNLLDGIKAQQEVPGSTTKNREVVEVDLQKTLPPIAQYDALVFREKFRKLAGKLGK